MGIHRLVAWSRTMAVGLAAISSLSVAFAGSPSESNQETIKRLTSFQGSFPTGLEVILSDVAEKESERKFLPSSESKLVFFLDGNFQGQLSSEDSLDKLLQGAVAATFQAQFSALSVDARVNLQNMINQALEDDHRASGSVQNNGVADIADPLFIERLMFNLAVIEIPSERVNEQGEQVALLYLSAGAGRGEIYAAKIMPWQRAMDLLGQERLTQTDQVFVSANILGKLYVKVAAFGYDWIGFPVDEDNRSDLAAVQQEGEGSFSVSAAYDASKLVEKIGGQLEFSILFANVKDGYFNPNRPVNQQVDDYRLYAARADFKKDKIGVSIEGFYRDPNESSEEAEWGIVAQASYQVLDRVQVLGEYAYLDQGNDDAVSTLGGGLTYSLYENVKAYAMLRHNFETSETMAWLGIAVEGAVYNVNEDRIRHIAMAEQIGRSE